MNDLAKRMGELRDNPGAIGAWVRLYGSEMEYGRQNVTAKNTSVQVGADRQVGDWKIGGAFSYTDGQASYDFGEADNKSCAVALYGTWMAEKGLFLDLIGKYGRISNDFRLNGMDGDFDNNAYSASVEVEELFGNFLATLPEDVSDPLLMRKEWRVRWTRERFDTELEYMRWIRK